jgi:hypothetical protein
MAKGRRIRVWSCDGDGDGDADDGIFPAIATT